MSARAIARLTELGWTVKPDEPGGMLFEVNSRPPPPMKESASYFAKINRPFRLHFQQVPSLDGLHFIANVRECTQIEIGAGTFTDVSELSGFSHLEKLIISQAPFDRIGVIDPSPLSSLINLRELSLNLSRVRTSDFLAPLKNLRVLNLGGTLISDISPLLGLTNLEQFEIRDTRVTDLRPPSGHTQLKELTISGVQVPSLTSLADLPNLARLTLIEQSPVDLTPIGALGGLISIFIWGLPEFDVSAIGNLQKLEALQLSGLGFGRVSSIKLAQGLGNEDRQASRDEKGDRGAGASVGRDHASHVG
jgi:Leucine-rich repeat (LRR) protein